MKISPTGHKSIYLIACLCLAVGLVAAAVAADSERLVHKENYELYEAADALFRDMQFEASYQIFQKLSGTYKDTYILDLKMAVCAINLGMWAEAATHSEQALKLYPLLAADVDFMDGLSYSLKQLGEYEAAEKVVDYYYDFARYNSQY